MLCGICEELFTRTYWQRDYAEDTGAPETNPRAFADHHSNLRSLRKSALEFCFVCHAVLHALMTMVPSFERLSSAPPAHLTVAHDYDLGSDHIHNISIHLSLDWEKHILAVLPHWNVYTYKLGHFTLDPNIVGTAASNYRITSPTTETASCALIIRQWFGDCIRTHPNCERLRSSDWYPTRLLDVSNPDRIQLVETKTHRAIGPYMTLSHSWGTSAITKLTRRNLEAFKDSIPVTTLPKTFIDAISVAQTCNIQYLWIDSLCILQDSVTDWSQEASQMSEVYRNSFCNIGASVATDKAGGLFRPRDPNLVNTFRFSHDDQQYSLVSSSLYYKSIEQAPLYKRGWVVQERWLCPRMLHFGAEQILWECRTARACESLPDFVRPPEHHPLRKNDQGESLPERARGLESEGIMASKLRTAWNCLIFMYSEADLTFKTDKLVAFSGLARTFNLHDPGDEYLAGIWKRNCVAQLPWFADSAQRYSDYIAPSWSWISVDGAVWPFCADNFQYRIQQVSIYIEHHLEFRDTNERVQLESGWVRLQGPVQKVMVCKAPLSVWRHPKADPTVLLVADGASLDSQDVWLDHESTDTIWTEQLYYLALVLTPERNTDDDDFSEVHGILLRLHSGTSLHFSRVGYGMVRDMDWIRKATTPSGIETLSGLPFDAEKGYTLTII